MKETIRIQEYGPRIDVAGSLSDKLGLSRSEAQNCLLRAAESIRLRSNPTKIGLRVEAGGVSAEGIAGNVGLHPRLDLEIVPKYADPNSDAWKNDLLFLLLFSRYGSLMQKLRIAAGAQSKLDLLSIAGLMLLSEIRAAAHQPLRQRQKRTVVDFDFHGRYDAADVAVLGAEGVSQTIYEHSRENEFGAVIGLGLSSLASRVRDPQVKEQLRRALGGFGKPANVGEALRWKRLPQRLAGWQSAYDLAYEFGKGKAIGLDRNNHESPGFIVDTWRMWQESVYRCCAMAFGVSKTTKEPVYPYANSWLDGVYQSLSVEPDVVIQTTAGSFVIDAKYKSRFSKADKYSRRVGSSDLHQAAVTIPASSARKSILMLPSPTLDAGAYRITGNTVVISNQAEIAEIELGILGVSSEGGLSAVVRALKAIFDSSFSTLRTLIP